MSTLNDLYTYGKEGVDKFQRYWEKWLLVGTDEASVCADTTTSYNSQLWQDSMQGIDQPVEGQLVGGYLSMSPGKSLTVLSSVMHGSKPRKVGESSFSSSITTQKRSRPCLP